jgi:hypothetical protein
VRFGPWHPLERAAQTAPEQPGLLQARAPELLAFPRGRSAMVLYAASDEGESLADFVRGRGAPLCERAASLGARFVRYAAAARPAAELDRLLRQFTDRFGAPPPAQAPP